AADNLAHSAMVHPTSVNRRLDILQQQALKSRVALERSKGGIEFEIIPGNGRTVASENFFDLVNRLVLLAQSEMYSDCLNAEVDDIINCEPTVSQRLLDLPIGIRTLPSEGKHHSVQGAELGVARGGVTLRLGLGQGRVGIGAG